MSRNSHIPRNLVINPRESVFYRHLAESRDFSKKKQKGKSLTGANKKRNRIALGEEA
jgi:hypothetical protein